MSDNIEMQGSCGPGFLVVSGAFVADFSEGKEVNASFVLVQAGEVQVDLWVGF